MELRLRITGLLFFRYRFQHVSFGHNSKAKFKREFLGFKQNDVDECKLSVRAIILSPCIKVVLAVGEAISYSEE